jgi:hypothetical protein
MATVGTDAGRHGGAGAGRERYCHFDRN